MSRLLFPSHPRPLEDLVPVDTLSRILSLPKGASVPQQQPSSSSTTSFVRKWNLAAWLNPSSNLPPPSTPTNNNSNTTNAAYHSVKVDSLVNASSPPQNITSVSNNNLMASNLSSLPFPPLSPLPAAAASPNQPPLASVSSEAATSKLVGSPPPVRLSSPASPSTPPLVLPVAPGSPDAHPLAGPSSCHTQRKTLRPSHEELMSLGLKQGANDIEFRVKSVFQGIQSVQARIFLWKKDTRIVISDIDGTITKSDVLGHLMTMVGRDWSHSGVASLFTTIHNNDFEILYLSSRAIGQADTTREYLQGVTQGDGDSPPLAAVATDSDIVSSQQVANSAKQSGQKQIEEEVTSTAPQGASSSVPAEGEATSSGSTVLVQSAHSPNESANPSSTTLHSATPIGIIPIAASVPLLNSSSSAFKLPAGPLFLSPDRLVTSFKREVIDRKPYLFKIACLKDIKNLFPPNSSPFYAGFGNRDSDRLSYRRVGIPDSKIFLINPSGVVVCASNGTYQNTYTDMTTIADSMFPPPKSISIMSSSQNMSNNSVSKQTSSLPPSKDGEKSNSSQSAQQKTQQQASAACQQNIMIDDAFNSVNFWRMNYIPPPLPSPHQQPSQQQQQQQTQQQHTTTQQQQQHVHPPHTSKLSTHSSTQLPADQTHNKQSNSNPVAGNKSSTLVNEYSSNQAQKNPDINNEASLKDSKATTRTQKNTQIHKPQDESDEDSDGSLLIGLGGSDDETQLDQLAHDLQEM